jgi:hypothetical protein
VPAEERRDEPEDTVHDRDAVEPRTEPVPAQQVDEPRTDPVPVQKPDHDDTKRHRIDH